jgi:hypothetical protein
MTLHLNAIAIPNKSAGKKSEKINESIQFSEQQYFDVAHQIADFILESIKKNPNIHSVESRMNESPNPFYSQTKQ